MRINLINQDFVSFHLDSKYKHFTWTDTRCILFDFQMSFYFFSTTHYSVGRNHILTQLPWKLGSKWRYLDLDDLTVAVVLKKIHTLKSTSIINEKDSPPNIGNHHKMVNSTRARSFISLTLKDVFFIFSCTQIARLICWLHVIYLWTLLGLRTLKVTDLDRTLNPMIKMKSRPLGVQDM